MSDSTDFLEQLRRDGWARDPQARLIPMSGGVSSDIYLVEDGAERYVIKRALAKLRVKSEWLADTSRNVTEWNYIKCVGGFLPNAVPHLIFANATAGYFIMEYLGEGFANWKQLMLQGQFVPAHASIAGHILGEIHRRTADNPDIERTFDTLHNFHQLRLEPYLLTAGKNNLSLNHLFIEEVNRLSAARECLVHGDFSPKNLLIRGDRMIVLDCEVGWYGDSAFDLAFLLNHLFLKALYHAPQKVGAEKMITVFWKDYLISRRLTSHKDLETRTTRLLLMLMLARVDGKSPVEYFGATQGDFIRRFTTDQLNAGHFELTALTQLWFEQLGTQPPVPKHP